MFYYLLYTKKQNRILKGQSCGVVDITVHLQCWQPTQAPDHALGAPLPNQLPANSLGKAAGAGTTRGLLSHMGDPDGLPVCVLA